MYKREEISSLVLNVFIFNGIGIGHSTL